MARKLCIAHAWLEVADRVEKLTGHQDGFLCCEIDDIYELGLISAETRDAMKTRIAEDLGVDLDRLGFKAAYVRDDDDKTDEQILADRAEDRAARVFAALMFAHEVLTR